METAAENEVWAVVLGSQLGSSLGSSGLGAGVAASRSGGLRWFVVGAASMVRPAGGHPAATGAAADQPDSAAQAAPMLGGLPLGALGRAGSGINALRVPARAYVPAPAAG